MIPARILRSQLDDLLHQRRHLSTRHLAREDDIIRAATAVFADHGRCAVTFGNLAIALRIGAATLRRYFPDLDDLFQQILLRHLAAIQAAFARMPMAAENPRRACRAAYQQATRDGLGLPSALHLLLIRQRYTLPPDLLEPIENTLASIASLLGDQPPDLTFAVLDNPFLTADQAAAMLDMPLSLPAQDPVPEQEAADPAIEIPAAATPRKSMRPARQGSAQATTRPAAAGPLEKPPPWSRPPQAEPPAQIPAFAARAGP